MKNAVRCLLYADFAPTDTSLRLAKATGAWNDPAAGGIQKLVLMDSQNNPTRYEVISWTTIQDNTDHWLISGITRGQEGTAAVAFVAGDLALDAVTAGTVDGLRTDVDSLDARATALEAHAADTGNPHGVTAAQAGALPDTTTVADIGGVPATGGTFTGAVGLPAGTTIENATPWHAGNFDPNSKADAAHTHLEADITGLDKYTQAEVDTLLAGKADTGHTHSQYADVGAAESITGAWNFSTVPQVQSADVWHPGNFDPTTKAAAVHTHVSTDLTDFNEAVQDVVGAMVSGNTETGITVTYQDADGTLDFSVPETGHTHRPAQWGYYRSVTLASGSVMWADYGHRVDVSAGPVTLTLPSAATGRTVAVYCTGGDFSVNNLTILRNGAVTIMGLAEDLVVDIKNAAFTLYCNGTDWRLI